MAFTAISNAIPKARNQWNPNRRGGPNEQEGDEEGGGLGPKWVPKPEKKKSHCTDGYERVRVPLPWGGYGWTCEKIKSGASAAHNAMVKQVTGVRQITPVSGADLQDRKSSSKLATKSYTKINRVRNDLNEDIY
jgi:hypothetical protein